jgi:hypothetical protein
MAHQSNIVILKDILGEAGLLPGKDGAVYARFTRNDEQVTYATTSEDFLTWVNSEIYERVSWFPTAKVLKQAIKEAEFETRMNKRPLPVCNRLYAAQGKIWVNLGWQVLKIDASGVAPSDDPHVLFPTRVDMLDLPDPEEDDALEVLPDVLGLDDAQCLLVLIWFMALFQAEGRYPPLIISGPSQSGKTRLATNIRQVVDRSAIPVLPLPRNSKELMAAAAHNFILAFDNAGVVPGWLVEELLALSKGTAFPAARGDRPIQRKAPTILVCDEIPDAPDLIQNAIILRLKDRPAVGLLGEVALDQHLEDMTPKAFGSLAYLAAKALAHFPGVQLEAVYRDAASEKWIAAADLSLGPKGKLMAALRHNTEEVSKDILNDTPALRAFMDLLKAEGSVATTASDLLNALEPFLKGPKGARWPKSGKAFASLIRRHMRYMPNIEIEFVRSTGKNRDRNIVASLKSTPAGDGATAVPRAASKRIATAKKWSDEALEQPSLI